MVESKHRGNQGGLDALLGRCCGAPYFLMVLGGNLGINFWGW